jgi:hypothetical protein
LELEQVETLPEFLDLLAYPTKQTNVVTSAVGIVLWQRGAGVLRAFSFRHPGHPQTGSRSIGASALQIVNILIEPYPSRVRASGV